MDLGLHGKVMLVTGGASGIGEAIVRLLAEEGAVPVILDRDEDRGGALVSEIGAAVFHPLELTSHEKIEEVVRRIIADHSKIDGVFNNAGFNDSVSLKGSPEDFEASLQLNLVPAFTLVRHCLPYLQESEGVILNVSSKVCSTGQGGTSGYAASKGGMNALTREWAVELASQGVRVNAVVPAEVMTPMYERWISSREDSEALLAQIAGRIPLGHRFTSPEEIAATAVFVSSPRASHTTGQILHVDGGYVHLDRSISQLND